MIYKSIALENYRNYEKREFTFHDKVNFFLGENGRGKTNLLESIYLTSYGKSFRTFKDRELIRFGEDFCRVKGTFVRGDQGIAANDDQESAENEDLQTVEIYIGRDGTRKGNVDGIEFQKYSDIFDHVLAVVFSPEDLKIIKESPEKRRGFLDREISTLSLSYYRNLLMYGRILSQRNAYLKEEIRDMDLLAVWDENRIHYGASLIWQRYKFIRKLSRICAKIHHDLTGGKESLLLEYAADCGRETFAALENGEIDGIADHDASQIDDLTKDEEKIIIEKIREELREVANLSMDTDFRNRHTTRGPQKDDIKVMIDGIDARHFGSQGQQRTAALSLKLAEIELVKKITKENPILLLDDVLSELDSNRQNHLLNSIGDTQTVITCTGLDDFVNNRFEYDKVYKVTEGTVQSEN
jgi:DNA replication and repair protein RecF